MPIECDVKYKLNGEEISAENLGGKSGEVKIIIEYKNNDEHIINVNGKDEKLYTPFVVICGAILDNTIHKNISVSNGKVIDDGSKTFVLGMALPGLKESLNMNDIDIPSNVEITMNSTNFEIGNIASFVTPKVFEETDLTFFDELDDIFSKVNTLNSSSSQLENGANVLKSGANTFYEKSQEFNSAMKQISDGADSANENYSKINNGIDTLNKSSLSLSNGAKQISEGTQAVSNALGDVSNGVSSLKSGSLELKNGIDTLNNALAPILSSIGGGNTSGSTNIANQLKTLITETTKAKIELENINSNLQSQINAFDIQISNLEASLDKLDPNATDYTEMQASIKNQIATLEATKSKIEPQIQASINANIGIISSLNSSLQTYNNIANLMQNSQGLSDLATLPQGMSKLSKGADALAKGAENLQNGVNTLEAKTKDLSGGAKTLYDGAKELSIGTDELNKGSNQMKSGLDTLSNGTSDLTNANNQLTEGAKTLSNGANTLADGVSKFNKEGISPICNYINGDLKDVSIRLEKLQELANNYDNFTMLNHEAEGNVKFIMIMDGIKKMENCKEEAIIDNKKSN